MDIVSQKERSRMMAGIRGTNTSPERIVRSLIFKQGFRYRLNRKGLPGAPDIVLPQYRLAIFVHGCFWHLHAGCKYSTLPKSRTEFWSKKLHGNKQRDSRAIVQLSNLNWRVLVVWECATRVPSMSTELGLTLHDYILSTKSVGEIGMKEGRLVENRTVDGVFHTNADP